MIQVYVSEALQQLTEHLFWLHSLPQVPSSFCVKLKKSPLKPPGVALVALCISRAPLNTQNIF